MKRVDEPLDWSWFLFSLEGRISRRQYWLNFLLPALGTSLALGLLAGDPSSLENSGPLDWLALAWSLALLWPGVATQVKRWHDRGKSGWWYLINLIPIVGGIWAFIETGCLAGDENENRFGPSPKQETVT